MGRFSRTRTRAELGSWKHVPLQRSVFAVILSSPAWKGWKGLSASPSLLQGHLHVKGRWKYSMDAPSHLSLRLTPDSATPSPGRLNLQMLLGSKVGSTHSFWISGTSSPSKQGRREAEAKALA